MSNVEIVQGVYDAFAAYHSTGAAHAGSTKIVNYWVTAALLLFLPILMPLLASLGASFQAVFDYDRRHGRYDDLADHLGSVAKLLPTLVTKPDITRVVLRTERILNDELVEWYVAQKSGLGH